MAPVRVKRYHRIIGKDDVYVSARPPVSAKYKLAMIDINKTVICSGGGTGCAYLFKDKNTSIYMEYTWEQIPRSKKNKFIIHKRLPSPIKISDFVECNVKKEITQLGEYK